MEKNISTTNEAERKDSLFISFDKIQHEYKDNLGGLPFPRFNYCRIWSISSSLYVQERQHFELQIVRLKR